MFGKLDFFQAGEQARPVTESRFVRFFDAKNIALHFKPTRNTRRGVSLAPKLRFEWTKDIFRQFWGKVGLNHRPTGYESAALTTELLPLNKH